MLSTPIESRNFWLKRVSDAATALAVTRPSECSDGNPKPSEVEIRYFDPSYGRVGMQASSLIKYKVAALLVGMVAVVLAISLTAFLAVEQSSLRGIHQLTQHAIGLSSSLGSPVAGIGNQPTARLVARPRQGAVSRGPTPLGLAVEGRAENAVVVVAGLAPDMELSAGNTVAADKWQISAAQLGNAWIAPPEGFSGSIDLIAELHLSDGKIADQVAIRVEWVSPSVAPPAQHETALEKASPAVALASASAEVDRDKSLLERPLLPSPAQEQPDREESPDSEVSSAVTPGLPDREEIAARPPSAPAPSLPQLEHQEIAAGPLISRSRAQDQFDQKEISVLLNRGKNLMASGDLAAARIVLRRAVDANNAEAALALAATYDPFVLRELKVYGFTGDAAMARAWYEKAAELGSSVAPRRLEILTRGTDRPLR
jgi:TPR repeat protein